MTDFELAKALFRKQGSTEDGGSPSTKTTQVYGYATSDSVDGSVTVVLYSDAGGEDAEMEVPTLGGITEGAEVMVTLLDGTPVDCSQVGSIDTATTVAVDAKAVADATAQHVWTDDSGLHVTEVTQDEWSDEQGASYHSGMNVLLNALGQLFRNGLNNMLGIVSGATPSISIYDGAGNNDGNIVASFARDLIELGKGSAAAVIKLCGHGTIEYDTDYNFGSLLISNPSSQTQTTALFAGDGSTYAEVGVQKSCSLMVGSTILLQGDNLTICDLGNTTSNTYARSAVINALPVTLFDNDSASPSASTTLSETAANFKRLTIFFKDTDNNCSSVEVWNPNGKRVSLSLTWINGTSTQSMYQRVRYVTISGTTIETSKLSGDAKYRTGQIQLGTTGSVTNSDYISITHVIGYR